MMFDFTVETRADQWLAEAGQPTNTDLRRQMAAVAFDRMHGGREAIDYLIEMRRARTTWCGVETGLRNDVDRIIEIASKEQPQ